MLDFLARRIAISILTFPLITLIVFPGVRMIPGDPARVMAGRMRMRPASKRSVRSTA